MFPSSYFCHTYIETSNSVLAPYFVGFQHLRRISDISSVILLPIHLISISFTFAWLVSPYYSFFFFPLLTSFNFTFQFCAFIKYTILFYNFLYI